MTGSEVFASLWNVLFDGHFGITKPDQFHLPIFFGQHGGFLGRAWRSFRLVVAGELLASVGDHLVLGSAYQPSWMVIRF